SVKAAPGSRACRTPYGRSRPNAPTLWGDETYQRGSFIGSPFKLTRSSTPFLRVRWIILNRCLALVSSCGRVWIRDSFRAERGDLTCLAEVVTARPSAVGISRGA